MSKSRNRRPKTKSPQQIENFDFFTDMPHDIMAKIHEHTRKPVVDFDFAGNSLESASNLALTNKKFNSIFHTNILDKILDRDILHDLLLRGNKYNEETILHVIKSFPLLVKEQNDIETPLLLAIKKKWSINIINALISAYPEAMLQPDDKGNLPLHVVVFEILKKYIDKNLKEVKPDKPACVERYSNSMAYTVRQKKRVANTVRILLESSKKCKQDVNLKNSDLFTPLSLCIRRDGCLEVIRAFTDHDPTILEKWLDSDEAHNVENWALPVHIAAYMGADFEIVEFFTEMYPESMKIQDKAIGRTPLHWAIQSALRYESSALRYERFWIGRQENNRIKTIVCLLEKCPESIMIPTFRGKFPVITAIDLHEIRPDSAYYIKERDPGIMINLMRMHLNHSYKLSLEISTVDLKKKIQHILNLKENFEFQSNLRLQHEAAFKIVKEIELHEESIDAEVYRDSANVIGLFKFYWDRILCRELNQLFQEE